MEKLCIFCKNIEYYADMGGEYSDPATWECKLDHWPKGDEWPGTGEVYAGDLGELRKVILIAAHCPDYMPPK